MNIPEVVQAVPNTDYTVDILFHDGKQVKYDARPLLEKGLFKALCDMDFFMNRCTVMNHTLAWDLSGEYDPTNCLDIDPETLYNFA